MSEDRVATLAAALGALISPPGVVHYDDGDGAGACQITGPSSRNPDAVTCVECLQDIINGHRCADERSAKASDGKIRSLTKAVAALADEISGIDASLVRGKTAPDKKLRAQIKEAQRLAKVWAP